MNRNMKPTQNIFTHKILMIKLAVKELRSAKFYAILLVSVMLAGVLSLSPAISSLMNSVIIGSTGRLATATTTPLAHKSEIRGVFIHEGIFAYPHDWSMIASTLAAYKINVVYVHILGGWYRRPHQEWVDAINAFHAHGIKFNAEANVIGEIPAKESTKCIDSNGNAVNWNCPTNPEFRQMIKENIEYVAGNYDIDGFTFDYARYPSDGMCYCSYCKAAFEKWLGETITDWPGDFAPGGSRYNEFMEWRVIPITELVRDIREWMLAINPDLEFRAAAWTLFGTPPTYAPTYWRYWIGQDTADWINKGYLDQVGCMMYTTQLTGYPDSIEACFEADTKYLTGGPEGKIPLLCSITTGIGSAVNPNDFKAVVDKIRELGADGWIIWRYGGPGCGLTPDIRDYLDVIDLPPTFKLSNIGVENITETSARITWTTDLSATSRVEYSTSPLFNASFKYWDSVNFHYWDVDHVPGTVIEDLTPVTDHSIVLTGLLHGTKYYFRVQGEDVSGIATSKVLTFTTS